VLLTSETSTLLPWPSHAPSLLTMGFHTRASACSAAFYPSRCCADLDAALLDAEGDLCTRVPARRWRETA